MSATLSPTGRSRPPPLGPGSGPRTRTPAPRHGARRLRTPLPARGCCPRPPGPDLGVRGPPPPRPGMLYPPPPIPARDPEVPVEPPAPGAAVPRLMTARPARAAAARSRSRAPGAGGGIAAAAARRGRGKGGPVRGARGLGGEGEGGGGPRLRLHRPGGRRGRGEGAGGARRGGRSCCRPGEGAALTGRKADQSGQAGGRGGGAEGGRLLEGEAFVTAARPLPPPAPAVPAASPPRIPRTPGRDTLPGGYLPPASGPSLLLPQTQKSRLPRTWRLAPRSSLPLDPETRVPSALQHPDPGILVPSLLLP